MTIEDIEKDMENIQKKLAFKIEIALDLLDQYKIADHKNHDSIKILIEQTSSISDLNLIIRLLNHSICYCYDIDIDMIKHKINNEKIYENNLMLIVDV